MEAPTPRPIKTEPGETYTLSAEVGKSTRKRKRFNFGTLMQLIPSSDRASFEKADRAQRKRLAGRKGVYGRRIIHTKDNGDGTYSELHATKGWRTYRRA